MNFTTDLPKSRPYVTYIVASAVKCEKFFPNSKNEGPSFRMHAVILNKKSENISNFEKKDYILCHIRKIDIEYKASKIVKNTEKCEKREKHEKSEKSEKSSEESKNENYEAFCETKPKKLKKDEICENFMKVSHKSEEKKEAKNEGISEENLRKNAENVKFRKMNLNLFQMFCVNSVIDRDFSNLVNEFCKIPEKKPIFTKNFFPEVIHEELSKKEPNNERDYAKMFNSMS